MAKATKPPWKRPAPSKGPRKASKHLSPQKKAAAKAAAKRAGRPYPNLVDNMRMAKSSKTKATKAGKKAVKKTAVKKGSAKKGGAKKSGAKKKASRKRASKTAKKKAAKRGAAGTGEKDPKGGLTAAGRKAFAKREGAYLKPGVTRREADMSADDMRRKGSWAVRFYGRAELPPLVDKKGRPTRLALSAHAWGEPVPKTPAAAKRIAAKGERLLARYKRLKSKF